ncbi:MAG: hypothetical protein Q8O25_11725 [Sulfurisoma sp.]|nr:hypothetical protein [Sulfurisoma sp.]
MIQLDTLPLPAALIWADEYASQAVAQTARRTLDGGQVVFYGGVTGGRQITLQAGEDTGWLTKTQADAVALRAASPGGVYTLILRGQTFQVMFRHHEPPAFEATPLWPLANPQPGDFYLATLKLMTL